MLRLLFIRNCQELSSTKTFLIYSGKARILCFRCLSGENSEHDKFRELEEKERKAQEKAKECLKVECKKEEQPPCRKSDSLNLPGRDKVEPRPTVCKDTCGINDPCKPYINPCPHYSVKPCSPFYRTVDPCREPCKRPPLPPFEKTEEISLRTRKIILAVSTLVAGFIIYKALTQERGESGSKKKSLIDDLKDFELDKVPPTSNGIPTYAQYVIVGGGAAAYSAMQTLFSLDENAKILVINREPYYPYKRVPLDTELVLGDESLSNDLIYLKRDGSQKKESVYYEDEKFYLTCEKFSETEGRGVSVARGWAVASVNPCEHTVKLDSGHVIKYDKCLLATGSSPVQLAEFSDCPELKNRISNYHTIFDFQQLQTVLKHDPKNIVIIGGGYTGTELAHALLEKGKRVTMILTEDGLLPRILPSYLSQHLLDIFKQKYGDLFLVVPPNYSIMSAMHNKKQQSVEILMQDPSKNFWSLYAEYVIVAVGNTPNTELAKDSGLELDEKTGGFITNGELQIREDLYGAGDCVSFYDGHFGRRRIGHYEHAVKTGKLAAENMLGQCKSLDYYYPTFWSDMEPDVSIEGVGLVDATLPTVGVFSDAQTQQYSVEGSQGKARQQQESPKEKKDQYKKGVVFYLKDDTIVGVLCWNVLNKAFSIKEFLHMNYKYKDVNELVEMLQIDK